MCDLGISDGPNVSALTNGLDTPEERYTKLKKVWVFLVHPLLTIVMSVVFLLSITVLNFFFCFFCPLALYGLSALPVWIMHIQV